MKGHGFVAEKENGFTAGMTITMGPPVGSSRVVVDGTDMIVRSNHEALEQTCAWSTGMFTQRSMLVVSCMD